MATWHGSGACEEAAGDDIKSRSGPGPRPQSAPRQAPVGLARPCTNPSVALRAGYFATPLRWNDFVDLALGIVTGAVVPTAFGQASDEAQTCLSTVAHGPHERA